MWKKNINSFGLDDTGFTCHFVDTNSQLHTCKLSLNDKLLLFIRLLRFTADKMDFTMMKIERHRIYFGVLLLITINILIWMMVIDRSENMIIEEANRIQMKSQELNGNSTIEKSSQHTVKIVLNDTSSSNVKKSSQNNKVFTFDTWGIGWKVYAQKVLSAHKNGWIESNGFNWTIRRCDVLGTTTTHQQNDILSWDEMLGRSFGKIERQVVNDFDVFISESVPSVIVEFVFVSQTGMCHRISS